MPLRPPKVTAIAVLTALFGACSNDGPLSPGSDSDENQPDEASLLLPLAAGAHWKYRLTFKRSTQTSSAGSGYSFDYYGTLDLQVTARQAENNFIRYSVETRLVVDTLHHYQYDNGTYENSSYYEFNVIDTTLLYTIVAARDTLWYEENGNRSLMLADDYTEKGEADLRIFSCPPLTGNYRPGQGSFWKTDFVFDSISGRMAYRNRREGEPVKYILYLYQKVEPEGELTADFYKPMLERKNIPGFTPIHWFRHQGGNIGFFNEELNLSILEYTPGVKAVNWEF